MTKKYFLVSVVITLWAFLCPKFVDAYSSDTSHKRINEHAVTWSDLDDFMVHSLGFVAGKKETFSGKKTIDLITEGGEKEDSMWTSDGPFFRPLRHFHDPVVANWGNSGLWGNESLVVWMLSYDEIPSTQENKYSWPWARRYFYNAVIGDSSEYYYALVFRSLGQLMHLVSDASVPAHVRGGGDLLRIIFWPPPVPRIKIFSWGPL